jgi:hypothetical protein
MRNYGGGIFILNRLDNYYSQSFDTKPINPFMTNFSPIDELIENTFEATLQKVQGQLDIKRKDTNIGLKLLTRFDELKKYQSLFVHKVTELKGKSDSFIILLIEKHLTIIEQKRSARIEKKIEEVEPILIFNVPHDMGKVYIRKETLADKIIDTLIKVDIDFHDYPEFSMNYYVVGDRPDHVKKYFPTRLMDAMSKITNMTVEINRNLGLLRTEKNLTEDVLLLLLNIGYKMTR